MSPYLHSTKDPLPLSRGMQQTAFLGDPSLDLRTCLIWLKRAGMGFI